MGRFSLLPYFQSRTPSCRRRLTTIFFDQVDHVVQVGADEAVPAAVRMGIG